MRKKNFELPDPSNFSNAQRFFKSFLESNDSYSQRQIAKEIGWPAGYMPDVIAGRKTFTVNRALSLSIKFGLNDKQTIRLILLSAVSCHPAKTEVIPIR